MNDKKSIVICIWEKGKGGGGAHSIVMPKNRVLKGVKDVTKIDLRFVCSAQIDWSSEKK